MYADPLGLAPPPDIAIPRSVNMQRNIVAVWGMQASVLNPSGMADFANRLRMEGVWDYKQESPLFQAFGNYHYGVVSAAAGFDIEITLRAGGLVQNITCLGVVRVAKVLFLVNTHTVTLRMIRCLLFRAGKAIGRGIGQCTTPLMDRLQIRAERLGLGYVVEKIFYCSRIVFPAGIFCSCIVVVDPA